VDLLGEVDCLVAVLSLVEEVDYPVAVNYQEEVEAA
jgi:hypothetical protein